MLLFCIYVVSINNAQESQKSVVQQKVDDADIEDAALIIPTLTDVMAYNDFREGITGQRKRLVLGD